MTLLASPLEANQANGPNDEGKGVWWRADGRAGPSPKRKLKVRLIFEGDRIKIERMTIGSSTGTLKVYQPPSQLVNEQNLNNTESLRASNTFTTTGYTLKAGGLLRFEKPGFSVEAGGGAAYGDPEIESKGIQLNVATKTGGNDWGGWFGGRAEFQPDPDSRPFVYVYGNKVWLDPDAERTPPEAISGATILLDTSTVHYDLFTAGAGVGLALDADRKYTIKMGTGFYDLDVSINRTLHFLFASVNQRQEFEGRIQLERKVWTFEISAQTAVRSWVEVEAGGSIGSGARRVFILTKVTR